MTDPEAVDVKYELVIGPVGCVLTCGGEVTWVSEGDTDYLEDFGADQLQADDEAACDELLDWLEDQGYIPPDCDVSIVEGSDECEP